MGVLVVERNPELDDAPALFFVELVVDAPAFVAPAFVELVFVELVGLEPELAGAGTVELDAFDPAEIVVEVDAGTLVTARSTGTVTGRRSL